MQMRPAVFHSIFHVAVVRKFFSSLPRIVAVVNDGMSNINNNGLPPKPHPDFPLSPMQNGQWFRKIKGASDRKSKPYYFGSWRSDSKGERAIKEYDLRLPGIFAGTDHMRYLAAGGGKLTVAGLCKQYLTARLTDVQAGKLTLVMYGDYMRELGAFVEWVKGTTPGDSLKPEHFTAYASHLVENRKLMSRSRKRTQGLVKAMFNWGMANELCRRINFGTAFKAPSTTREAIRQEKARLGKPDHAERIVMGEEIDRLLDACKGKPNMRAMILIGINCGFGPSDIGRLRWRHMNLKTGRLYYPRPKNGNKRMAYLWKRTREAIQAVESLTHTAAAFAKDGKNAPVFITRSRNPYYREEVEIKNGDFRIRPCNAISITFGRMAKKLKLEGVSFYRLRHTFKTFGKRAKDRDALNLCMGHKPNNVEAGYDHQDISFRRVRRIAIAVKKKLWPKPKHQADGMNPTT